MKGVQRSCGVSMQAVEAPIELVWGVFCVHTCLYFLSFFSFIFLYFLSFFSFIFLYFLSFFFPLSLSLSLSLPSSAYNKNVEFEVLSQVIPHVFFVHPRRLLLK